MWLLLCLHRLPLTMGTIHPSPLCWTTWTFSCCQSLTLMDTNSPTPQWVKHIACLSWLRKLWCPSKPIKVREISSESPFPDVLRWSYERSQRQLSNPSFSFTVSSPTLWFYDSLAVSPSEMFSGLCLASLPAEGKLFLDSRVNARTEVCAFTAKACPCFRTACGGRPAPRTQAVCVLEWIQTGTGTQALEVRIKFLDSSCKKKIPFCAPGSSYTGPAISLM